MWICTFYLVLIGWVFFRAVSLVSALEILATMHRTAPGIAPANGATLFAILCSTVLILMHVVDFAVIRWSAGLERRAWLFWPILFALQTICFFVGVPSNAFIYFQF